ncbi:MAG: gas vesicle protein [Chloroherpetonaceae bacterium]|nr:gas vesicle protein [Chloroherpetonaceae bacterium]MDW8438173.1 gas vesicle protein GvpJ [Chloroherpetonaceae bacterium]
MNNQVAHSTSSATLADILERVIDKGVVVAGDIKINLADVELLNVKIRLLICSVDKAVELGIDWWRNDAYLSSNAEVRELRKENQELKTKLAELEQAIAALRSPKRP